MSESTWEPLFTGDEALPYGHAIDAIRQALDSCQQDPLDWGAPLLQMYLARARPSSSHERHARELVDDAISAIEESPLHAGLYSGVAGVAWLTAHTQSLFGDLDERAYDEIDATVLIPWEYSPHSMPYDLISGSVGLGLYFLERLPAANAIVGLNRVVTILRQQAERFNSEARWLTPPALVPRTQRRDAPYGYYNLGVAHGIGGVIGLLSEVERAKLLSNRDRDLLRAAIRWLLKQQQANGGFPNWVGPSTKPSSSRVAWCYGELGLAVSLLVGARALGDADTERRAIDIALHTSRRRTDTGAVDAGLCHGATGNAHLFNRLYQGTGREEFRDAARFWYASALQMRIVGGGVGGYRSWKPYNSDGERRETSWEDDASFLTGAGGIALAFLAAISSVEPEWDRVLLTAIARAPVA